MVKRKRRGGEWNETATAVETQPKQNQRNVIISHLVMFSMAVWIIAKLRHTQRQTDRRGRIERERERNNERITRSTLSHSAGNKRILLASRSLCLSRQFTLALTICCCVSSSSSSYFHCIYGCVCVCVVVASAKYIKHEHLCACCTFYAIP